MGLSADKNYERSFSKFFKGWVIIAVTDFLYIFIPSSDHFYFERKCACLNALVCLV